MDRHSYDWEQFKNNVIPLILEDLEHRYGVKTRVFDDGDLEDGKLSYITLDKFIVLDPKNIPNMVRATQTICHEYCHIWREVQAKTDSYLRDIHDFYLNECYEYRNHVDLDHGRKNLVYRYSLLELDARFFEETFGTEYTDRYFSKISASHLREAYANKKGPGLVELVLKYYPDLYRKNHNVIADV